MRSDRLIASFLVLGETLNYTEAARRLYLSHQALSKQIVKLEEALGYPLFSRSTRTVALTAVGELFYAYFKEEAARYAQVCLEAERLSRIQENDLRVGFPLGIQPPAFFGAFLQEFQRDHPDRRVRMEWHDVDALTRRFEAGTLDVAFSLDDSGLAVSQDADRVRVAPCRLVLAAVASHPAWAGESLSAFSGQTFLYEQESTPESTNAMRQTVAEILQAAGVADPHIELVPNIQSRQTAVELGAGCCLCVDLDTLCANPLVRFSPLDRPPSYLSCYWKRECGKPIVGAFVRQFRGRLKGERETGGAYD